MSTPDPGSSVRPTVSVAREGETVEIRLSGELDLAQAQELEAAAASSDLGPGTVVVDLSAATFIDSTVISWVVGLASRTEGEGGNLLVVAGPGPARRALEVSGVVGFIPVVDLAEGETIPLPLGPRRA